MDPNKDSQMNPNENQSSGGELQGVVSSQAGMPPQQLPQPAQPTEPKPFWRKIPWKIVAGIVAALVVIAGGYFIAKAFLFNGNVEEPQVRELLWWGFQFEEEDVSAIISEYEKKTGIRVVYVKQAKQDYKDRLTAALEQNKQAPDIFEIHNSWPVMFDNLLSRVPSGVYNPEVYRETFYPVMSQDLERSGGFVGIPLVYDGLSLFVNTSEFTREDKLPPDTWNEVRELSAFFTKRDTSRRIVEGGIPLGRTENVNHWQDILALMLTQEGARLDAPTGVQVEVAFRSYVQFADPYDGVWNETLPFALQAFSRGQTRMYFGKAEDIREIWKINPDLQFRTVPMPQLPKATSSQPDVMWASYWVDVVSEKSKKRSAAWDFLKYMSSREVMNVLANGKFVPSRQDLADLFREDPLLGAFIKSAPSSYSWYLASDTYDGAGGINSRVSTQYKTAVSGFLENKREDEVLGALSSGVLGVLSEYKTSK